MRDIFNTWVEYEIKKILLLLWRPSKDVLLLSIVYVVIYYVVFNIYFKCGIDDLEFVKRIGL